MATTAAKLMLLLLLLLLLVGLPTSAASRQTCPQVRGFMAARTVRLVLVPHFLSLLRYGFRVMSGTQIPSLLNTGLRLLLLLLLLLLCRLATPAFRFLLEEPLHQSLR